MHRALLFLKCSAPKKIQQALTLFIIIKPPPNLSIIEKENPFGSAKPVDILDTTQRSHAIPKVIGMKSSTRKKATFYDINYVLVFY
jgi:hypothetical protein